jgi:hypothetical protein
MRLARNQKRFYKKGNVVQNLYYCERLLELDAQERARQQRREQRLREAGVTDHAPGTWLTIIAALLAFLRLG